MHSKAFFPSNDSEEINERILPTPKPFKNDLNYNFQSFDKKNLRESDQNPLNSFSSIAKMSNHNENEENFNLIPTNSLKTRNSDETMCENQFHLDDHINNIHLFDKEDSLNLGQVNFFPIYQKKHEMCKAKSNFKMRGPIVSEFTLSLDSETSNNLMKSKNEMHFSEHFNNFLNRKLIEKNDDLFDLNQKTYKSEDYQNNKLPSNKQSFQCSISSSINFELSNSLNNIFNSFNQSLNNRSIFSTGSDKENTPPLMQDQIKAYAIDNKNQNNLNFIVKCELAENGIESNGLETNEDIPLILTLQNDTYKTKYHNNFSLDLIVILSIKNIDSMSFFNRKNILQNFEYIFSCLNENDRFGLIKLGSSEKLKNINFLQKLSTLSKSMKKLMIQFLSYESFSNENIDIIKGLETAIETLNQRSYRNNYTSIVVISDMIFDKNVEKAIIIEKISNIQKKLKDYGFLRDTCFNISCVYCGTQSDEIFFLDHLSFINRGEIYYCKRLRALKVK